MVKLKGNTPIIEHGSEIASLHFSSSAQLSKLSAHGFCIYVL